MLFKDTAIEKKYVEDGFVILPVLDEKVLTQIKSLYHYYYSHQVEGLQPLLRTGSSKNNIEMHYQIAGIVTPVLEKWFKPFAFNANHFIVKGANDPNEFRLHQDWNVVDETRFIAAHIWIALQDIDQTNGGLFVATGSHKFFENYRSGSCGIAFIERTEKVRSSVTNMKVKAGEAVVYQQALFHGSYPNTTNQPRLVCLSSIRPVQAPMVYFHQQGEQLQCYEITPEVLFEQVGDLEKGVSPRDQKQFSNLTKTMLKTKMIDNEIFEERI
ncbi:MAG: phytanoyl-CoA dioxygenase family protein [Bacteroidota bacterium]